ncbi:unnamed protein product [Microthlaspi erraticum]|uniref:Uncharacterized protein n=1 Tax=Microthlaspi erraticum TaxID=1685480 RepID=A0A6D2I9I4_9BRAS|nr:unnamed protein product [Microthlaspi erraticum]
MGLFRRFVKVEQVLAPRMMVVHQASVSSKDDGCSSSSIVSRYRDYNWRYRSGPSLKPEKPERKIHDAIVDQELEFELRF